MLNAIKKPVKHHITIPNPSVTIGNPYLECAVDFPFRK